MCAKEQERLFLTVPHLSLHDIQCNTFQLGNHYDLNYEPVTDEFTFFLLFQSDIGGSICVFDYITFLRG